MPCAGDKFVHFLIKCIPCCVICALPSSRSSFLECMRAILLRLCRNSERCRALKNIAIARARKNNIEPSTLGVSNRGRRRAQTKTIKMATQSSHETSKYSPGDTIKNCTVVVTGSNRGIGLELASELLKEGNVVVCTARKHSKALQDLREKFGEEKVKITTLDVGDEDSIEKWADSLKEALHGTTIDVLINNAGIIGTEPGYKKWTFDAIDQREMMEVFKINACGPLLVSQALVKRRLMSKPALIANVTSKVGSIDDNGSGKGYAYRASKTALNIINKSMSIDLKDEYDISSLLLHPGWVQTDMTENRGLIETPECAKG